MAYNEQWTNTGWIECSWCDNVRKIYMRCNVRAVTFDNGSTYADIYVDLASYNRGSDWGFYIDGFYNGNSQRLKNGENQWASDLTVGWGAQGLGAGASGSSTISWGTTSPQYGGADTRSMTFYYPANPATASVAIAGSTSNLTMDPTGTTKSVAISNSISGCSWTSSYITFQCQEAYPIVGDLGRVDNVSGMLSSPQSLALNTTKMLQVYQNFPNSKTLTSLEYVEGTATVVGGRNAQRTGVLTLKEFPPTISTPAVSFTTPGASFVNAKPIKGKTLATIVSTCTSLKWASCSSYSAVSNNTIAGSFTTVTAADGSGNRTSVMNVTTLVCGGGTSLDGNGSILLTFTDSRGLSTAQTLSYSNWQSYISPYLESGLVTRAEGAETSLQLTGVVKAPSILHTNGSQLNGVGQTQYRWKEYGSANFSGWISVGSITTGVLSSTLGNTLTTGAPFAIDKEYAIEVKIKDTYGTEVTYSYSVPKAAVNLSIRTNSVGVNSIPPTLYYVNGNVVTPRSFAGFYVKGRMWSTMGDTVPVGSVTAMSVYMLPSGYLECIGQYVNIADYPDLYSIVGTFFGSGSGSFRLPDYTCRVLGGIGTLNDGQESITKSNGMADGTWSHYLTYYQMPSHSHQVPDTVWMDQPGSNTRWTVPGSSGTNWFNTVGVGGRSAAYVSNEGNGNLHSNRQPTAYIRWLMKY